MILVTGAGGSVGSEVVKQLRANGAQFRAAYHSAAKAEAAKKDGLGAVAIDFANPETLAPAFAGVDTMFLLFAGGMGQAEGEIGAVRAARDAGVKKIVTLSVWGAETEAFSFAKIHRPVEREIEASGLAWTHLRPNGFMQNMVNYYAGTIKAQGAFYQPAGEAKISHVDIRDIAAVAVKAMTEAGHDGKAYALSGPEAVSYGQIAAAISTEIGKPVNYVAVSDEDGKAGMVGAGIPEFYADYLIDLNRFYRKGGAETVTGDVKAVAGREPISFARFAKDFAGAFR